MKDNTTENIANDEANNQGTVQEGPDLLQQQALAELEAEQQNHQPHDESAEAIMRQQHTEEDLKPKLQNSNSAVAVDPKQNKLLMLGALFIAGFAVYYFFFSSDPNQKPSPNSTPTELPHTTNKPPAEENIATITTLPSLPSPPPLVAPTPPPAPIAPTAPTAQPTNLQLPNVPTIPSSPTFNNTQSNTGNVSPPSISKGNNTDMSARQKSSIMLSGGGGGAAAGGNNGKPGIVIETGDNFSLSHTGAAQENAKTIGNMSNLVAQGKMIDAVLETAINSDFAGTVRAIVSRDVYAEAGRNVLIPKGSRLIGNYATGVKKGQKRIAISWTRVIRADGIDITIDSASVDQLGRMGTEGYLDNKYFEMITNSLLVSTINIGVVEGVSKLIPAANVATTTITPATTTTTGGTTAPGANGTTTTATPTQQALQSALTQLGGNMQSLASDSAASKPTMTIDQGTLLKVFVSKDLIFPGHIASQIRYVQ